MVKIMYAELGLRVAELPIRFRHALNITPVGEFLYDWESNCR